MSDPLELARWQGSIDERTKMIERRMDALNGDVAIIRNDIGEIKAVMQSSEQSRFRWEPLLEQLHDAAAATKAAHEQRASWLEGWRLKTVVSGALLSLLGVASNVVLNLLR